MDNKGFTLVELVSAIVLIGVVSAIGVSEMDFEGTENSINLEKKAQELSMDINKMQASIHQGYSCTLDKGSTKYNPTGCNMNNWSESIKINDLGNYSSLPDPLIIPKNGCSEVSLIKGGHKEVISIYSTGTAKLGEC